MRVVVGEESRWLSLGLPDPMVLVFPTSLMNVRRPRVRSQIVPCMSLVLVVCSDCCCHIVQAEDGCIAVVVVGYPHPLNHQS
jgi:hypothetical protein